MPLMRKHADEGERHHEPDAAALKRDHLLEVNLVPENRLGQQRSESGGPVGVRTRSKIGRTSRAIAPCAAPATAIRTTDAARCTQ